MVKIGKGTPAMGRRHTKTHCSCRRCGRVTFHMQRQECASCGYPRAGMRRFSWGAKALRRRTTGVGRQRHLKTVARRFKNGFRENTQAKPKAKASE